MQPIQLEPGMRVRCVDNRSGFGELLEPGREYRVISFEHGSRVDLVEIDACSFAKFAVTRFKPIVRVKANSARLISRSLVSRKEHVGSIELGNKFTKYWVERADRNPHIFNGAGY